MSNTKHQGKKKRDLKLFNIKAYSKIKIKLKTRGKTTTILAFVGGQKM